MCANSKDNSFSVPPWVKTADVAVWISDHFGDICYINSKAEKLFGCLSSECIGKPCHLLVCGADSVSGHTYSSSCFISKQLMSKIPINLLELNITNSKGIQQQLNVLVLLTQHPSSLEYWLVHCALSENKDQMIKDYLYRVSTRTPHETPENANRRNTHLSKREDQILQLLSKDKNMKEIAYDLHLSYATIRNHVHHILSKLKVHSIVEAIAFNLLKKNV